MGELQRRQRRPARRAPAVVRVVVVRARRRVRRPRGGRRGGGGGAGGPPLDPLDEIGRRLDLVVVEEGELVRGYVKAISPRGCFVSLSRAVDAFVRAAEGVLYGGRSSEGKLIVGNCGLGDLERDSGGWGLWGPTGHNSSAGTSKNGRKRYGFA